MDLDKKFWDEIYLSNETKWDVGSITGTIKDYIDQVNDKTINILIPGCGFGHEAEYIYKKGFKNTFVADISNIPLLNLHKRCPDFPEDHLWNIDFFKIDKTFDLILEQTFFCALDPSLRPVYAEKMHSLLNKDGKLVGLLFDDKFNHEGPPFGGTKEEYISYFRPWFEIKYFDKAYNSISPRAGRELFISLKRIDN
jgi:methyl halide transferase